MERQENNFMRICVKIRCLFVVSLGLFVIVQISFAQYKPNENTSSGTIRVERESRIAFGNSVYAGRCT